MIQNILTAGGIVAALSGIFTLVWKLFKWIDHQKEQDKEIAAMKKDLEDLKREDLKSIKTEQTLITYGVLACLKGLKEQGCNGPVTEAINKIEKHLNIQAHQ